MQHGACHKCNITAPEFQQQKWLPVLNAPYGIPWADDQGNEPPPHSCWTVSQSHVFGISLANWPSTFCLSPLKLHICSWDSSFAINHAIITHRWLLSLLTLRLKDSMFAVSCHNHIWEKGSPAHDTQKSDSSFTGRMDCDFTPFRPISAAGQHLGPQN